MAAAGSVSHWLDRLQAGDHAAAQPLWEVYFQRLVALARARLQGAPLRAADEEDVALSAFDSFCRGVAAGRFPQLADRAGLWRLLVTITGRKALDRLRHERRQKRGGGAVEEVRLEEVVGSEPTPDFAAQVAEECRRLLGLLGDAELEAVALWKMEGYRTAEIAARLGYTPRTVERKLRLIRQVWEKEGLP
ncbi:MAG TPA: ECF-type sigma factor [Gemmataceae bacterium]|nr:ECF-type sigma factor [Gemmataceae bacterium]